MEVCEAGVYDRFEELGAKLEAGILQHAKDAGVTITVNRLKGALAVYFTDEKVKNYVQASASDGEKFAQFFRLMLEQGINLAPSKYEAWFITTAHTEEDIDRTLEAVKTSFEQMK